MFGLKLRYILVAAVAALVFGIFAVGQNAAQAQRLADQVVTLDSSNQSTTTALKALSDFSHSHMGASQSVFLAASYQRAQVAANATPNTSGQVYHDAQAACVSHTTAVNQANCVQSYVASHATPGVASAQPVAVNQASYRYSYTSPRWTPDLAGGLLLVGVIGGLAAAMAALGRRH